MIVTIDGPAGSGKSTVAKIIAIRYNFIYLDTGAIYRSLAYLAKNLGIDVEDEERVISIIPKMSIDFVKVGDNQRVFLNGIDVTVEIRTEEIGMLASKVSRHRGVRSSLLGFQRSFKEKGDIVAEGRDTGTVVFPEAEVKVFLTASIEERARRRWKELMERGIEEDFEKILESIKIRDEQDSGRDIAPLIPAEDAIIIDTTNLSIEDVVERIGKIIDGKRGL